MRPTISTNLAISADGKISTVARRPSGWTSAADRERFRELRAGADALLVGRGTWEADRMKMTAPQNPLRCVVSASGNFDPEHPMFHTPGGAIHLLVTGGSEPSIPAGARLHRGPLDDFLSTLHRDYGVKHLHCEGGGELIRALADLDFIDDYHLTWAGQALFGGLKAPTPTGLPGPFLSSSREYELTGFAPDRAECFLTYRRKRD